MISSPIYLSTIQGLSINASAVIHVKKLLTKINVSVGDKSFVLFEKHAISANKIVASNFTSIFAA